MSRLRKRELIVAALLVAGLWTLPTGMSESHEGPETADTGEDNPNWTPVTNGLPTSLEYYGVFFGDVNNDGKLDVAAQGGGMHVYVGDGLGNFAEESSGLPASGGPVDLILADFTNDGNLDIVGSEVLLGNGGAGGSMVWTPAPSPGGWNALTAADMNLDGNMDLIAGGAGVRVWTGNGGAGGTLVWTDSSVGLPALGNYWGVDTGDIDHDGKPDVVAADANNGIKAWTGNGGTGASSSWTDAYTGTDLPSTDSYANVALGDVNNDGNLDVVTTAFYSSNGNRCFLGNGGAGGAMTWTENSTGLDTTTSRYLSADLEDVDNDGDLDIFATHYQGMGLTTWLGDGGAGGSMDWTQVSDGLPTGNYIDVDAGDYNNDGKIDFATSYISGVEVWENERPDFVITGYSQISNGLPTTNRWADVLFEDVDHDGSLDVGFTSFQNEQRGVRVYRGDGSGNWVNSSNGLTMGGGYGGMRFDDLNHDGTQDIVAAGVSGSAGIDVWNGSGTGTWIQEPSVALTTGGGVEKGDLNNDGNTDVVTGFYSNDWGPMVHLGDGDLGWSGDEGPTASTMNVDDVSIADVNHDGKLDFAASSMNNIGVQLWTGDGSGLADSWVRNDTGLPTSGVNLGLAFGDVNHDGDPDLAAAGFGPTEGTYVFTGNGGSGGSMLWQNDSSGLPMTGGYGGAELCDLDLDGNLDLVYGADWNGAEGLGVRMGNGGAGGAMSWSDPAFAGLPTTSEYWGVACGDVDNDGLPEIGAAMDGGVEVWTPIYQMTDVPLVAIGTPNGMQDWSGSNNHDIIWDMSDAQDPNALLTVYINYSYNAGTMGGPIVGPILGGANPNTYTWTTPSIDATDVTLNVTVIDTEGYVSWDETLVPVLDSTSPTVQSTLPLDGATGVARNIAVQTTWDELMDAPSTESAFALRDNLTWSPVPGTFSWTGSIMTFTPDNLLNPDEWFTANYTVGARDDSDPGNSLTAPYSWSFRTAAIVDLLPPEIADVSAQPSPQEVYLNVSISANITDDVGVQVAWANVTWPDMSWTNQSMSRTGDYFFLVRGYPQLGGYSFTIWASDVSGNWNSSSRAFQVVDTTPPSFLHTSTGPWLVDEAINLTVTATDNFFLNAVRARFTDTEGAVHNESMIFLSGNEFYFEVEPQTSGGTLSYFFWAEDSSGNAARSQIYGDTVIEPMPRPPENLAVSEERRDALVLQWDAPTENVDGSPLTDLRGYNLYRMLESGGAIVRVNTQLIQEPGYVDENLEDGRTYYYIVRAVNSRGIESSDSNEATGITLKPQVDDYTWLIILIIVITVIAIVVFLLLRRRKREEETQSEQM
jgi:hypothetical protein